MITAVDANVLIDVGLDEPGRSRTAAEALAHCGMAGDLIVCDVALAEVASGFGRSSDPAEWVQEIGVRFVPISEAAAVAAGRLLARYASRSRSGSRRAIADFLIGAHALLQADRLLTRDRGFYRDYFKGLRLMEPK